MYPTRFFRVTRGASGEEGARVILPMALASSVGSQRAADRSSAQILHVVVLSLRVGGRLLGGMGRVQRMHVGSLGQGCRTFGVRQPGPRRGKGMSIRATRALKIAEPAVAT